MKKNESPLRQADTTCEVKGVLSELMKETSALRTESCLSQGQVATKLGMASHSHIAAIESGRVVPRLDTFLKILSLYNCSIRIVRRGEERENDQVGHF